MAFKSTDYRSLFLPLARNEKAVFADFFPLLTISDCPPGEGGALSGPLTMPAEQAAGARQSTEPLATPPPLFSPAEGGEEDGSHASASFLNNRTTADASVAAGSLLFTALGARTRSMIVVLQSRELVFYSLTSKSKGPVEVARRKPTATATSVTAAKTTTTTGAKGGKQVADAATATCATLLPLELSYVCRIQMSRARDSECVYLRGAVGSSDGRVSLFSERGYASSFPAHSCPVTGIDVVSYGSDASYSESAASGGESTTSKATCNSLGMALERMCIITAGTDRRILKWVKVGTNFVPSALVMTGPINRHVAYAVHQPTATEWFFSVKSTSTGSDVTAAAEPKVLPRPTVIHTGSPAGSGLWCTTLSAEADKKGTSGSTPTNTLVELPGSILFKASALATNGAVCLAARHKDVYFIDLRANGTTTSQFVLRARKHVTAIVMQCQLAALVCGEHGFIHLLRLTSCSATLLGEYLSYQCRPIQQVSLRPNALLMSIVEAATGSVELVQLPTCEFHDAVLTPPSAALTSPGAGVAAFSSTSATVVSTAAFGFSAGALLPSAAALRQKCLLRDLMAGTRSSSKGKSKRGTVGGSGTRELMDAAGESVMLASAAVPEECNAYLHPSVTVL